MPVIGTLPYTIADGQLADAIPVQANFDWIVSQVNANSGASNEWVASGLTPTYISATQFSVLGDRTAIFTVRRRILLTVSAVLGGATVTASSFGAGITTVTVVTDTTSFLTASVTDIAYGLLDPTIISTPQGTNFTVASTSGSQNLSSAAGYHIGETGGAFPATTVTGDIYAEFAPASAAKFTPVVAGFYLMGMNVSISENSATVTDSGFIYILVNSSGVQGATRTIKLGTNTFWIAQNAVITYMNVGDYAQGGIVSPTFSGGPMKGNVGGFWVKQLRF